MKLLLDDCLYLQNFDIVYLLVRAEVPKYVHQAIVKELFQDEVEICLENDEDMAEFECGFTEPEVVNWLLAAEFIDDFSSYNSISADEIYAQIMDCRENITNSAKLINLIGESNIDEGVYDHLLTVYGDYVHFGKGLEYIYRYKMGDLLVVFPMEYFGSPLCDYDYYSERPLPRRLSVTSRGRRVRMVD